MNIERNDPSNYRSTNITFSHIYDYQDITLFRYLHFESYALRYRDLSFAT